MSLICKDKSHPPQNKNTESIQKASVPRNTKLKYKFICHEVLNPLVEVVEKCWLIRNFPESERSRFGTTE